jgi:hypothetical protein
METAPSEPRIRVGPQHQVNQPDIYVRIDVKMSAPRGGDKLIAKEEVEIETN